MKTSNSNQKNNKTGILVCLILLAISTPIFSQNKLVSLMSSINFTATVPIVLVFSLAVFLFTAFIKQKNH